MEQIGCYISRKAEVRKSKIGGKGLFAIKDMTKGETIFIKAGHIVDAEEARRCRKEVGDYDVQISDDFFLTPASQDEVEKLVVHFNHSCEPNAGPEGQITFVALRDIKSGEEITCDYATFTAGDYRLECHCGSAECRGIITGDDWKSTVLQMKYGNNFSWYLLKKIKNLD